MRISFFLFILNFILISSSYAQQKWWQGTSIYQIYPRSFKDSNGDGIGDIRGVISKLDYLKSLGVETLWLSPFFLSPQKDFGYDISDYRSIAPEFGTMADVEELIAETHRRGMHILFDMVMNHTSDQHPWFQESRKSKNNPKSDWYLWRDQPNNWVSAIGKPGWHYDSTRKQWYFASFLPFQPDLNYRNPEVKKAMLDQVRFWLEKGVDGFRLDIFNVIYKDAQFRNNPKTWNFIPTDERVAFQIRKYTVNLPESYEFAKELRKVVDEYSTPQNPKMLVGEVMGTHDKIKPYLGEHQDGLNLIFLFDILKFKFNADFFRAKLQLYEKEYAAPLAPTFVFSNHDQIRSMTRLKGDPEKAKLLSILQFTARGVPVLYQGEEIGMANTDLTGVTPLDPIAYVYSHVPSFIAKWMKILVNRDVVRTPFQWDKTIHAGFCDPYCKPWLPVASNSATRNVEVQERSPASVLSNYKSIIAIRNNIPAFRYGSIQIASSKQSPKNTLIYDRVFENQRYRVVLNFSNKARALNLAGVNAELQLSSRSTAQLAKGVLSLAPWEGAVLKISP